MREKENLVSCDGQPNPMEASPAHTPDTLESTARALRFYLDHALKTRVTSNALAPTSYGYAYAEVAELSLRRMLVSVEAAIAKAESR